MRNLLMILCILVAMVCGGRFTPAYGLAGDLETPSLAFSEDFKEGLDQKVLKVLNDKQYQFKRGRFINAHTTLSYGGDIKALNHFLKSLGAYPEIKLRVSFESPAWTDGTWAVSHNAWVNAYSIHVIVNLEALGVEKSAVSVPPSEELPEEKEESTPKPAQTVK